MGRSSTRLVAQRTHHHAKNSAYYLSNITLETALHTVDGVLYASITYFMLHYRAFSNPANRACLFSPFPFAMCGGLLGGALNTIARGLTSTIPKPPTPPTPRNNHSDGPLPDLHRRDHHPVHHGLHARAGLGAADPEPGHGLRAGGRYVRVLLGWLMDRGWVSVGHGVIDSSIYRTHTYYRSDPSRRSTITFPKNPPPKTGYQAIAVLSCGIILPFRQIW